MKKRKIERSDERVRELYVPAFGREGQRSPFRKRGSDGWEREAGVFKSIRLPDHWTERSKQL